MSQALYETIVKKYTEISAADLEEFIRVGQKALVFIGKPVCPYCQRFIPKFDGIVQHHQLDVYYLNSLHTPEDSVLQRVRERLGVKTVPAVVTIDGKDQFTNLGMDSSFSEQKIADLLQVA